MLKGCVAIHDTSELRRDRVRRVELTAESARASQRFFRNTRQPRTGRSRRRKGEAAGGVAATVHAARTRNCAGTAPWRSGSRPNSPRIGRPVGSAPFEALRGYLVLPFIITVTHRGRRG